MDTQVKPFDSLSVVYKILIKIGFYTLLDETNNYRKALHNLFRAIAFVNVLLYNVIHIIFIIQPSNDSSVRMEGLMIVLPQMNLFFKLLMLLLYSSRIQNINKLLSDPIFAANGEEDEKCLLKNVQEAHRISRVMNILVTIAGVCWPTSSIIQMIRDESTNILVYVPFETDTYLAKFFLIFLVQILYLPWTGYGHIALDCLIVTYYSQAQVQLKIIKLNLNHLFDSKGATKTHNKEITDKEEYDNFVYYIKRYENVVRYTNEVNSIFNPSMTFQFLTSSAAMCLYIYKMSETYVLSVKFLFQMTVLFILLCQVFLYCYYGNLVRHESESVSTSLYLGEWTSTSLKLRRTMLIAMPRWSRPLTTQVAGIIPLALDTFMNIIKFSYTLYTVLSTKQTSN